MQTQFDIEAYDAAIEKVNYYSYIPSFIKGSSREESLNINEDLSCKEEKSKEKGLLNIPAHVVNGWITVINGRLNMPSYVTAEC